MVGSLVFDLRVALRRLRQSPHFVAVAVATLAVGIGLNATIYTFVDTVLLRPLPVAEPEELVPVYTTAVAGGEDPSTLVTTSRPDWVDLRAAVVGDPAPGEAGATDLFGFSLSLATVQKVAPDGAIGGSELVLGELATGNYFEVLGLRPEHGRLLTMDDDVEGAAAVAVVSWSFFERRLGGDPDRVGAVLRINGTAHEIVGVAPREYGGSIPSTRVEFWVPSVRFGDVGPFADIGASPRDAHLPLAERRSYRWLTMQARLDDGTERAWLEARLGAAMASIAEAHPATHGHLDVTVLDHGGVRVHPGLDGPLETAALLLSALVGLVLLVACANLTNMLLARAVQRRREVAVRLALGAGRHQVMRPFVLEVLLVALAGGTLALVLAQIASRALLSQQPPLGIEVDLAVAVDGRVALFTLALAVLAALLTASLPARQASNPDLVDALKDGGRGSGGLGGSSNLRSALVVAQVTVSTVLLVASALLLRGWSAARAVDPGLEPERLVTCGLNLANHGYDAAAAHDFLDRFTERVAALPGVEAATLAKRIPFVFNYHQSSVLPDSREWTAEDRGIFLDVTWADARYFETLGVAIERGRGLSAADVAGAPAVAVISRRAAEELWPGEDAVGRRFHVGTIDGLDVLVVGISADYAVRSIGEAPRPMVHFAWAQRPRPVGHVVARSRSADAAPLAAEILRIARDMDPNVALTEVRTFDDLAQVTLYPVRMGSMVLGVFTCLGLFLSAVGLWGMVSYAARTRQREIGVRVALGATRLDVTRLLLGRGLALVAVGAVVGLGASLFVGRALEGVLYGLGPLDPQALGLAVVVLLVVATAANLLPARYAARRDPLAALREE